VDAFAQSANETAQPLLRRQLSAQQSKVVNRLDQHPEELLRAVPDKEEATETTVISKR
jgi:hypothetical protein